MANVWDAAVAAIVNDWNSGALMGRDFFVIPGRVKREPGIQSRERRLFCPPGCGFGGRQLLRKCRA